MPIKLKPYEMKQSVRASVASVVSLCKLERGPSSRRNNAADPVESRSQGDGAEPHCLGDSRARGSGKLKQSEFVTVKGKKIYFL